MTYEDLVVIFGINSRQGSSVTRFLSGNPNIRIRGFTHDASCAASQSWAEKGVEIVPIGGLCQHHESALALWIDGAAAAFVVTDYFYRHLDDHSNGTFAALKKVDVHSMAAHREYEEGKAIVSAINHSIKCNPTLEMCVFSSMTAFMTGAWESPTTTPRGVWQFRIKSGLVGHVLRELPDLAHRLSLIHPALRMEDWTHFLRVREGGFTFGTTQEANFELSWTHFANDTGILYQLCRENKPGLSMAGLSDVMSGAKICELVTTITGKPCEYVQYSEKELVQLLGPVRGQVMVDILAFFASSQYIGTKYMKHSFNVITTTKDAALKFKLTSMMKHMEDTLLKYVKD